MLILKIYFDVREKLMKNAVKTLKYAVNEIFIKSVLFTKSKITKSNGSRSLKRSLNINYVYRFGIGFKNSDHLWAIKIKNK